MMAENDSACGQDEVLDDGEALAELLSQSNTDSEDDSACVDSAAKNLASQKAIEEFMNEASDSDSEEEVEDRMQPEAGTFTEFLKTQEADLMEAEMLASLVCADSEFEGEDIPTTPQHNPESGHQRSLTLDKESIKSEMKEDERESFEDHCIFGSTNSKKMRNGKESQHLEEKTESSLDGMVSLAPPSTALLQEELAKMQQRMLELQQLLVQQQQQSGAATQSQPVNTASKQQSLRNINASTASAKQLQSVQSVARPVKQQKTNQVSFGGKNYVAQPKKEKIFLSSSSTSSKAVGKSEENIKDNSCGKPKSFHLLSDEDSGVLFPNSNPSELSNNLKKFNNDMHATGKKVSSRKEMSKTLFGDSDDSDWEGMDGEEKSTLSESGREIKKLIQSGPRQREAHQPSFRHISGSSGPSQSWTQNNLRSAFDDNDCERVRAGSRKEDKDSLQCSSSSTEQSQRKSSTDVEEKFVTDFFSKIRIINPLVSASLMKRRMEGRKMVSVSRIHIKLNTVDVQYDWVTIGVMVGKSEAKASKSGKTYSILKLNDLEDLDHSVNFFLFGEVYKAHWKLDIGTVIGILNPSLMEAVEKKNSNPAFTVKNPSQVMVMGRSKDLGWCKALTKKGNKCSNFINKKFGDSCHYHMQAEYRKTSATRLEFHGSVTGIKPKSFEQKLFSKNTSYIYGGKMYTPKSSVNSNKSRKHVTLSTLQQSMKGGEQRPVNTLSINDIKPTRNNSQSQSGKIREGQDNTFMDMISVPSPGSMNLVAHLKQKELRTHQSGTMKSGGKAIIQSVTPKELLKAHQQKLKNRHSLKRKASELLLESSDVSTKNVDLSQESSFSIDPLKQMPMLGRGFYNGQDIALDVGPVTAKSTMNRSKLKAIAAVRGEGGLDKEDPNAVRKRRKLEDVEILKARVATDQEKSADSSKSNISTSTVKETSKKKSQLLGNVDLNSSEFKAAMNARSIHKGALAEAEAEREEKYFTELEKRELMEEKLQTIMSIEISVYSCKQCRYKAQSVLASCKEQGHAIVKSQTRKRFFKCKACKHRTFTIGDKFPTESCRKCGGTAYEKTSMYKERTGPKLESEGLNIRGDEVKYLNSLEQKTYLNTVIDD